MIAVACCLATLVSPAQAVASCHFTLGFKVLHDELPGIIGDCLENEQTGAGDHVQLTTQGTLIWRQADNLSAFTDGISTWVKGPYGVQQRLNSERFAWEAGRAGETSVKGIFIQLGRQHLTAYQDGEVVVDTPITSGGPYTVTPRGTFSVIGKRSSFMMKSPWPRDDPRWYRDSWVNYALLFERTGYFIHDAPWRAYYGPGTNLTYNPATDWTGTHGCVNVPLNAEIALYQWAEVGTKVVVLA